jgi:hypothetical protein
MRRYWLFLLALAVGGLVGSYIWWKQRETEWTDPVPIRPELSTVDLSLETLPSPPLAALDRPLLWASRRFKPVQTAKSASDLDELNQARLLSVVQSGDQIVVVIKKKDGLMARYNQVSQPWRVQSFEGRTATLVSADGQPVSLNLESASPAPPKGPR